MPGDTIAPREPVALEALESYLRLRGFESNRGLRVEQYPGGHSNLTYLIHDGSREYVLRRPPLGPVPPKAHDMVREAKVLAALHPVFHLAPRPLLICEESSVLGAPFYLMERRHGTVIRTPHAPVLQDNPGLRRRTGEAMLDALVALHSVDIRLPAIREIGRPEGFLDRQVNGWHARWQNAKTRTIAGVDELVRWLLQTMPACENYVVLHNDFKVDNVMVDTEDPSRIVAVLDWEMCALGDPLIDLGILLCYWPEASDPPARRDSISPVTATAGWPSRSDLVERYARSTGRDVSRIGYFEVFALFKVAVVLQQIYYRYHIGQTNDARFASLERRVMDLLQVAMDRKAIA